MSPEITPRPVKVQILTYRPVEYSVCVKSIGRISGQISIRYNPTYSFCLKFAPYLFPYLISLRRRSNLYLNQC